MPNLRIAVAEAIGTLLLILGGPGTAILATGGFFIDGSVGVPGVALAFGLSLLVAAYAVGPISGCHINPAVTFGSWLAGKTETARCWCSSCSRRRGRVTRQPASPASTSG